MKYKIRTAVPTDEGKIRELMSDSFEHDYNDLSDRTKEAFLDRYYYRFFCTSPFVVRERSTGSFFLFWLRGCRMIVSVREIKKPSGSAEGFGKVFQLCRFLIGMSG